MEIETGIFSNTISTTGRPLKKLSPKSKTRYFLTMMKKR